MTIPSWAFDACLDDDIFAIAYEAVPAEQRALLKTAIARHYVWQSPERCPVAWTERVWSQGFESKQHTTPIANCLLLFDTHMSSPADLLAALMPALTSGAGSVLAIRACTDNDDPIPAGILAAFELAGQETVVELPPEKISVILNELAAQPESCMVLAMGHTAEFIPAGFVNGNTRRVWTPSAECDIAVLLEGVETDVNLDALAFAYPRSRFWIAGSETVFPNERFAYCGKNFGDLPVDRCVLCYAPDTLCADALTLFPLVFGPGHEACRLWPDLGSECFQVRRTVWCSATQRETEE